MKNPQLKFFVQIPDKAGYKFLSLLNTFSAVPRVGEHVAFSENYDSMVLVERLIHTPTCIEIHCKYV